MLEIYEYNLGLLLDTKKLTCKVIESSFANGDIIIPRSIKYKDKEYCLTVIGSNAFKDNSKIKSLKFSEDSEIKLICFHSFEKSTLESINFSSKVKKIDECAFSYCYSLSTVTFPSNSQLLKIGASSFYLSSILSITIPASVHIISYSAFSNCRQLKTVEFHPKSKLVSICNMSFIYCTSLENIKIPKSVKLIGEYAFNYCIKLKDVFIEENSSLETIGKNAFAVTSIDKFFISSKLLNIDGIGISNWIDVSISPHNPNFLVYNNTFVIGKSKSEVKDFDALYFAHCGVERAVIPSFISKICTNAFFRHKKLKTLEFEKNSKIESIEDEAFNLSSVECVSIPCSVEKIGLAAFSGCVNLRFVKFYLDSNSIEKVDKRMYIQKFAFMSCIMLETIEFLGNNLWLNNDCLTYCSKLMIIACPNAECFCYESGFHYYNTNMMIIVKANSRIMEKM